MRRVVVTGLGLVTPLGGDVETSWANLIAGKSGAGQITRFDASNQKATIACEVKDKDHPWGFDADKRVDPKIQRQVDPFIVYGIDAAGQAIEDAGEAGYTINTVNGGTLTATVVDGNVVLTDAAGGTATVTATDVEASNGVIHVIDTVLMPQ